MVHAKNYETMSSFVKGMQKKTVASFFETQRINNCKLHKTKSLSHKLSSPHNRKVDT